MSDHLPVGFILNDGNNEYEILDCGSGKGFLGQGGFGITYLARDIKLDREVAIKEFFPSAIVGRDQTLTVTSRDKEQFTSLKKYFLGEARFLAGFDDPSIVKVLAFFEANNTAYLVMPYLRGDTVEDRYKQTAFSEAQAKALFLQLISGLKTVHANGLLHRDIKPANIKYDTKTDTPILIDFGSAREAGGTGTKSTVGAYSPHFSPIELNSTSTKKTAATDVYALGATIYRTLFQSGPPDAAHRFEQDDDGLPELEAALSEGRISSGLSNVLKRCLELRGKDRFQSLDDLEAALEKKETPSAVIPDPKLNKPVKVETKPTPEPSKVETPLIPPRAPPSKSVSRQPSAFLILMLSLAVFGAVWYFGFNNSNPDPVAGTEIILDPESLNRYLRDDTITLSDLATLEVQKSFADTLSGFTDTQSLEVQKGLSDSISFTEKS